MDTDRLHEVRDLIAELVQADPEQVAAAESFTEEFGADSLILIELLVRLEKRFGVEIPEDELPRLITLRSAYEVVASRAGW
ncbi:acyl carrier protein [Streptomyces morookaense]|uniref:Acyl carrier protein n=1 Tax=Streptomyces morookaense TaxID=1970 RepID=A0A7Y7AZA9_STRMO|nr:acyl carrier protein [Streptomyces morookaense]